MKQLKPETIETVKGYFLDGEINGEQYSQAEFEDIVTPFDLIHKPVYQIVESENYEESDVFGGYKSDRDLDKDRKHSEDFERLSREWIDNQEADFYAIVDDNESNELRIEFGGKTTLIHQSSCTLSALLWKVFVNQTAVRIENVRK